MRIENTIIRNSDILAARYEQKSDTIHIFTRDSPTDPFLIKVEDLEDAKDYMEKLEEILND